MSRKLKQIPVFRSYEEAEHFVDTADLSGFRPLHCDFKEKALIVGEEEKPEQERDGH